MNLKGLLCELLRNAIPQECDEEHLKATCPFELVGYGNAMGHHWRLAKYDDPQQFYIEDFGDFHLGKLNIDTITNIKAWNDIWDNVYFNHKGEKIILNMNYDNECFDFTTYNKYSRKTGEEILKYITSSQK